MGCNNGETDVMEDLYTCVSFMPCFQSASLGVVTFALSGKAAVGTMIGVGRPRNMEKWLQRIIKF